MENTYKGYWGPPNSIIDFCEPNYAVSHYFAEFFNALSSVPMIFQAIFGLVLTHRYATKEFRFKLCYITLVIIGVGSTLFHASLRYKYQLLDELPMLLASTVSLYCTLTLRSVGSKHYNLIALQLTILAAEISLYVYYQIWAIFFIGYALNVAALTLVIFARHFFEASLAKKYLIMSWALYYGAFSCWCVDMALCDYVQQFHLHSFWHLAAGYGSYLTTVVLVIIRSKYLKQTPHVKILCASDLLCMHKKNVVIDMPLAHYCTYQTSKHAD